MRTICSWFGLFLKLFFTYFIRVEKHKMYFDLTRLMMMMMMKILLDKSQDLTSLFSVDPRRIAFKSRVTLLAVDPLH